MVALKNKEENMIKELKKDLQNLLKRLDKKGEKNE